MSKTNQLETAGADEALAGASCEEERASGWTFLTNHTHVLICLWREPELRLRDVAARVSITERAVQRIVADLEAANIITRIRDGRRNRYEVHADKPLRHSIEAHRKVSDLLAMVEELGVENEV